MNLYQNMENKKTKVAFVRGDSLNEWEGKMWSKLGDNFEVTGFASKKNLYDTSNLNFKVKNLQTSTDFKLVHTYNKYFKGIFQKMNGLEKELKNFDIAHTAEVSYFLTNQAVRAKKVNPKLKVVTTVWDNSFGRFEYNYWPGFKMPPKFWRNKINKIIQENVEGVDMFLPITNYSKDFLLDLGVSQEKIKVLTPAIVIDEKNNDGNIEDFLNKKYSFDLKDKKIFLMVNRLVKEKGIYDVLYAWKMFIKEDTDKNKILLIIGKGPEEKNLKRMAREFSMGERVKFINYIPNNLIRNLYKKSFCLFLASIPNSLWQEQFGFVLGEAIINDCPIITTYSGAIPEVAESTALYAPSCNPVAIKNAIADLENQETYNKLKENCKIVKEKFEIERFKENLSEVYKEIIN